MSEHHPISDLMTETMSKIKEMVDVNTIIGSPIVAADGTTVIPVSKVSFFLVIGKDGSANILGINAQASDTVDRLVEMIPGAINKVSNFVSGFKGKTEDAAEVAETLSGDE